ncbi:bacterial alpha-L-rhamnosidase domain protein [Aspergillus heteromorphus CBS 117.55]|uniref:Bacterial alpha-L-rhamnosidase domain protein n=1 Tax=Aspergillus heteromorphus CBS 117.55 TaxID=1448321 RepID=A0A317WKE7_9EURO|nr:bacterial alpha-L-rhamnosidase domain protein [Aspergillus heteromorphus CBS 117.55]PWY86944.1 bacterial alpha-L-rhamnosidase domain protein [Aspergillus heteromorphus CBS 117.55]
MRSYWLLTPALLVFTVLAIPYEEYILAPASRNLLPTSVYQVNGSVTNPAALTSSTTGNTTFHGTSSVTYDFGRNIAGIISLDVASAPASAFIGVTFTESHLWISNEACDATSDAGLDSPLWFHVGRGSGLYTAGKKHTRGAFRYLTVVSNTTSTVSINSIRVYYTAAPTQDLRAYKGYFHSNDELINRIWYAGAYTLQLCSIDPSTGDSLEWLGILDSTDNITLPRTDSWWLNYTITNGSSTLVDGAKRDRLVWPGDMSIALESVAVSTADLDSIRTALESLFALQKANGRLAYAGKPFYDIVSFTYHLHSLIGASSLFQYTGDLAWLSRYWEQYKRGVQWALTSVDDTGLANITASADWLRSGMGAHNIEANAILYYVLNDAISLAQTLDDLSSTKNWSKTATGIKTAANNLLWDDQSDLYTDNETTTLHPQDGNAWALKANLTTSFNQSEAISSALASRWGPYGAPAPEAGSTVSPFIGGFELQGHYLAGQPDRALDLMRLQWGFMLDDPRMTSSSFIEGYSTDGSLVYAPYRNTPRVSHAHGWSTGPTSALTSYAAGLHLIGPAGVTWLFKPQPGNLTQVEAGFTTPLGSFEMAFRSSTEGFYQLTFTTPNDTSGSVEIGDVTGELVSDRGVSVQLVNGRATGLQGGTWRLTSP